MDLPRAGHPIAVGVPGRGGGAVVELTPMEHARDGDVPPVPQAVPVSAVEARVGPKGALPGVENVVVDDVPAVPEAVAIGVSVRRVGLVGALLAVTQTVVVAVEHNRAGVVRSDEAVVVWVRVQHQRPVGGLSQGERVVRVSRGVRGVQGDARRGGDEAGVGAAGQVNVEIRAVLPEAVPFGRDRLAGDVATKPRPEEDLRRVRGVDRCGGAVDERRERPVGVDFHRDPNPALVVHSAGGVGAKGHGNHRRSA